METCIETRNLTKSFPVPLSLRSNTALSDISLSVPQGSITALLGPNGSGKTTLLNILATLLIPDRGYARINGLRLGSDNARIRAAIGLMPDEERGLYWRLSGQQNIEFFASLYGLRMSAIRKRLSALYELFGVDYQHKRFGSYSTGMKKRFLFIKTLIHDPPVLLLDEPTKGLDYPSVKKVTAFLKDELVGRQKKTVLLSTHRLDEAAAIADMLIIMHKGRTAASDTLEGLRAKSALGQKDLEDIFTQLTRNGHAL